MNSLQDNIYIVSGVAMEKKVCIWALGRGARKSKLYSPPQPDRNWKPIDAFVTLLQRQIGQRTVSVLELVSNIGIFAWETETLLHSIEKNRNWFGRHSSIILILLGFPLPSFVTLILWN